MSQNANSFAGLPYEDINWYDIEGQPFGIGSYFNSIILGDANNIVDTEGAMAVGGNFVSPRGLSVGYGRGAKLVGTGYTPDFVRFLVGQDVAMQGPLVVMGHVVGGGRFRAANGSTYMIGKNGDPDQAQELSTLYQANGGSQYWKPNDRGTHYAISSYDVPRFIPAERINADVAQFFADARESLNFYHDCLVNLAPNGTVTDHFHEKILRGTDPNQNVFVVDASPNGILNKELRFEVPEGSVSVVIIKTGPNAHLQYGLWGSERLTNRTLYVFEDAQNIYMEVPAAIWGSILAPQAMFHGHRTGGNVNGNVALGSFAVNAGSGFEFHLYPFVGGVVCGDMLSESEETEEENGPECPACPEVRPCPEPLPCPTCPEPRPCPEPAPCPTCPEPVPCPACPEPRPCPEPAPCPACPEPRPCPPCPTCPEPRPCPPCPEPRPCPPCPEARPCPPCPPQEVRVEYIPYPVRVPIPCPGIRIKRERPREEPPVTTPDRCRIRSGVIEGCVWGCNCRRSHEFEVRLYKMQGDTREMVYCEKIGCCSCFEIAADYEGCYRLAVCPVDSARCSSCRAMLTLKNVGVSELILDA